MSEVHISNEAREAAQKLHGEYSTEWWLDCAKQAEVHRLYYEQAEAHRLKIATIVQLAINFATEKLQEENRKLKERIATVCECHKALSSTPQDFSKRFVGREVLEQIKTAIEYVVQQRGVKSNNLIMALTLARQELEEK